MGVLGTGWLTGCGAETPREPTPATLPTPPTGTGPRVLLAYFSRAGENYHYGGRTYLEVGNTEVLADMINSLVRPPMIMRTFAESYDFAGKIVLPVVTYAVSGLGRAPEEYARACAGATVGEGLAVRGEEVRQADAAVSSWLRRVGLLEE
jgi:hypothetical protein